MIDSICNASFQRCLTLSSLAQSAIYSLTLSLLPFVAMAKLELPTSDVADDGIKTGRQRSWIDYISREDWQLAKPKISAKSFVFVEAGLSVWNLLSKIGE